MSIPFQRLSGYGEILMSSCPLIHGLMLGGSYDLRGEIESEWLAIVLGRGGGREEE